MYFLFQLEMESLDQDNHLFPAELNCIIINALFLSFSTYRTVYNDIVLATFNLMFETNGMLISKCMWPIINYYF